MTRYVLIPLLLFPALTGVTAFAQPQNSDISIMLGPVVGSTQVLGNSNLSVKASGSVSVFVGFGHTLHSYSFADLWFETPWTFAFRGDVNVSNGVGVSDLGTTLFAPGVRLQVPVGSRVSFYGMAGGGYGSFSYANVLVGPGISVDYRRTTHGVFDFGGGMDFRLTRLVSLRTEVRDYVTGRNLGGVNGRNHPFYYFGAALHF